MTLYIPLIAFFVILMIKQSSKILGERHTMFVMHKMSSTTCQICIYTCIIRIQFLPIVQVENRNHNAEQEKSNSDSQDDRLLFEDYSPIVKKIM